MDNLDPGFSGDGDAEHLANLGGGMHGVFNAFAPISGTSAVLPTNPPAEVWEPQLPAPAEPPDAGLIHHPAYGAAVRRWVYRDADGSPLFAAVRFEFTKDGGKPGKEVLPYSYGRRQWTTKTGRRFDETRWHLKRPSIPVPLYGLDRLAARPDADVLLCEGEKSADAAGAIFPDLVAIASQGGSSAPEQSDWSAVAGRRVVIWPDADAAGAPFAAKASKLMGRAGAAEVRVVQIVLSEWSDKWDLADPLPPDVPVERLREMLDAAQVPDVDGEVAGDAGDEQDEDPNPSNIIPLALQKAYRFDDLEFATQKRALAEALQINVTELVELRRKHHAKIRDEERADEKAAARIDKEQRERDREKKKHDKEEKRRARAEKARRAAEAQAEQRAKPVSEIVGTVWPHGIEERPDGLYYVLVTEDEPDVWLCDPIEVLGMARDADGESWGLWLRWRDVDGRAHTWSMPAKLVMSRAGELEGELVERGLRIDPNSEQRDYLRRALGNVKTGARVTLATAPGWNTIATGAAGYVLINGEVIGSPAEQIVLKTPPENAAAKMRQSGTLEEWKAQVAGIAAGNPVAMFALCAAFAGPLLGPLGESSGGYHLFGRSKTGKTLVTRLGVSVMGAASKSGLSRDWRSTANAMESAAEESNDSLLTLDEIHQADPKEVAAAVYQLANESGKQRLRQDATAKRRRTWRTIVMSNGELDIASMVAKIGQVLPAGAEIRLPSIPIDGRTMWPELHGFSSATELMAALQKSLPKQYGTAIRPFLTKLADLIKTDQSGLELALEESRAKINRGLPAGADDQVKEVARRCALIALAGELAIDFGILPWKPEAADEAVAKVLGWWIERRGGAGATEESQHVTLIRKYLSEFGASRFVILDQDHVDTSADLLTEKYPERVIISRTGWRRPSKDGTLDQYLIDKDGWARICSEGGLDPVEVARTLKAAGHLVAGDGNNLTRSVRIPGYGKMRCYTVLSSIFEGKDG